MNLMVLKTSQDLKPFTHAELYQHFDPASLEQHKTDAHLVLLEQETPVARCSLWWQDVPSYQQHQLGLIGHYASSNTHARTLLSAACATLKEQGCTLAIGPMDGSTWRSYRFVTWGEAPPFLLEPQNPPDYPLQWQNAGFKVMADYFSALQTQLPENPNLTKVKKLEAAGITFRKLNKENLEAELEAIYALTLESFSKNFLYTPLAQEEFLAQYQQVLPYVSPELVLLAEHESKCIAFLFALPDLAQKHYAPSIDTFIIKTLATHPDYSGQGIAGTLTALVMAEARALGFTKAIHALMISSNHSRKISAHYQQQELRRYAIYARTL